MKEDAAAIVFITVILAALIAFGMWVSATTCERQARMMGMKHDWAPMQGCMIQTKRGDWVPLKNYRDMAN